MSLMEESYDSFKDINKAQVDIVFRLAKALKCDIQDLLD